MFSYLKKHPFSVEAFFKSSWIFTFAVLKKQVQHLIPPCLELDTHNDEWAFIAVAMVDTTDFRPKGFPAILGNDFFLTGYRVFVRYTNTAGKRLRGLYILKSETNKKKMEFLGNIFTHYNYTTTDIILAQTNSLTEIESIKSGFKVLIEKTTNEICLPEKSPFNDWKEARKFAGPLPFTFTFDEDRKEVLIIEGVRQNWTPAPIKVLEYSFSFLDDLKLTGAVLANAFVINNIPYFWKKGTIEKWNG
jgi:uncharacterized protein YqjF (DUF2071 family)